VKVDGFACSDGEIRSAAVGGGRVGGHLCLWSRCTVQYHQSLQQDHLRFHGSHQRECGSGDHSEHNRTSCVILQWPCEYLNPCHRCGAHNSGVCTDRLVCHLPLWRQERRHLMLGLLRQPCSHFYRLHSNNGPAGHVLPSFAGPAAFCAALLCRCHRCLRRMPMKGPCPLSQEGTSSYTTRNSKQRDKNSFQ
jgi:hypothetical protein